MLTILLHLVQAVRTASVASHADEASIILADLLRLGEGARAFCIKAAKIVLYLGDVGLEVFPDQVGIGSRVLRVCGKKGTLRGQT